MTMHTFAVTAEANEILADVFATTGLDGPVAEMIRDGSVHSKSDPLSKILVRSLVAVQRALTEEGEVMGMERQIMMILTALALKNGGDLVIPAAFLDDATKFSVQLTSGEGSGVVVKCTPVSESEA